MTSRGRAGFQDWAELRDHAIEAFGGETPHPVTEQEIIDAYELHPDAVEKAVHSVAAEVAAGTIRSGWGILRHRAEAIAAPPSNPKAKTGRKHEQAVARAEQWIRNAGLHYPWGDCVDDLRDKLGANPPPHLHALWQELQPVRKRIDEEAVMRARAWIAGRAALAKTSAAGGSTHEPAGNPQPGPTPALEADA